MPRTAPHQKAFTIIEVLMAATVLLVSFTAVIQVITIGADTIDTARKQQIAQQIIDNEINGQRLNSWASTTNMADGTTYTITVDATGTVCSGDTTRFTLGKLSNDPLLTQTKNFVCDATYSILRTNVSTSKPTFISIRYNIKWSGVSGRTHNRIGLVYLGEYGLQLSYQQ